MTLKAEIESLVRARSEATIKGHLDAKRKTQHSTKVEEPDVYQQLLDDAFPPQQHQGTRSHQVFLSVHHIKEQMFSDLTGCIPWVSSTGMQCLFIVYNYDSNAILMEPIKNRKKETLLEAYKQILTRLASQRRVSTQTPTTRQRMFGHHEGIHDH